MGEQKQNKYHPCSLVEKLNQSQEEVQSYEGWCIGVSERGVFNVFLLGLHFGSKKD